MNIEYHSLETCRDLAGVAVVIDVLRAFTTAAMAFHVGARKIILTDTVDSAFRLKRSIPGSLVSGEVDGYPVEGFDFSNSPAALEDVELRDRALIQRTSAGTQGVVRCSSASDILVASFVCAAATARAIERMKVQSLAFVITGGDEDAACADYIRDLLSGDWGG